MRVNRLKTTYQRNLLLGTIGSSVLIVFMVFALIGGKDDTIKFKKDDILLSDIYFADNQIRHNLHTSNLPGPIPDPGYSVPGDHLVSNIDSAEMRGNEFQSHEPESVSPILTIENNQDNLPITYNFSYDDFLNRPFERQNTETIFGYFRHSDFGYEVNNRPLGINHLRVRHPYNPLDIVDTVIVLMTIDNAGEILAIETIYDARPNFDFALNFELALRQAEIFPAIVDGTPTGGTYPLWCIFAEKGARPLTRNARGITLNAW
jgi:hypothetical protein